MTVPEITKGPKGRRVVLAHDMQFSAIVSLLHSLMVGGIEFGFYDAKYPSPSDPGAYFSYSPMNGIGV